MDKKLDVDKPLLLWCSSHDTLASEEIPLFLEAGFRVIPLLCDFWTFNISEELDDRICSDWKGSVGLSADIVAQLQRLEICKNEGMDALRPEDIQALNQHVDVIYMTVLPGLAIRLTELFHGTVVFRPFGHGSLNNYTRIANGMGGDVSLLEKADNFVWCPILSTLQEIEDPRLYRNPQLLSGFVSRPRLGNSQWTASQSQPFVVETIPRIEKQLYYTEVFKNYVNDYGDLPLKILGGNSPNGGELNDPRIVGRLDDDDYYRTASQARVSLYHGDSRYHVHYHPVEFMYLGVPVLFHKDCAIAVEAVRCGLSPENLTDYGMYETKTQAREMAQRALTDLEYADTLSRRQRFFSESVFDRPKALQQARWIRSVCVTINQARKPAMIAGIRPKQTPAVQLSQVPQSSAQNRAKRHWSVRTARELSRVCKKLGKTMRVAG